MLRALWRRLARKSNGLKFACLTAAGLLTAWTNPAEGTIVSGYIQPEQTISDVYLMSFHYTFNSSGYSYYLRHISDQILGGQSQNFQVTIPDSVLTNYKTHDYTIMALYDYQNDGVTIGIDSTRALQLINDGKDWQSYFGNICTETYYAWCIKEVRDYGLVHPVEYGYAGENYGNTLTLVNFSTASYGGVAYAEIPEPTSAMIILVGAGIAGISRRRLS